MVNLLSSNSAFSWALFKDLSKPHLLRETQFPLRCIIHSARSCPISKSYLVAVEKNLYIRTAARNKMTCSVVFIKLGFSSLTFNEVSNIRR